MNPTGIASAVERSRTVSNKGALLPLSRARAEPAQNGLSGAPAWRREPYRLLFPLGAASAWAGVLHWLLVAAGILTGHRSIFHSIVQIQGFMTAFAVGFLFTAIPRRTETSAPASWEMVVALSAPVALTVAAWNEIWWLSQILWIGLATVLVRFALCRIRASTARRRPPNDLPYGAW